MYKLIRKCLSLIFVIIIVSLVLNLNFQGRPSRDIAWEYWNHPTVQWAYQNIKSRVLAVINKDISIEEAFIPNIDLKGYNPTPPKLPDTNTNPLNKTTEDKKITTNNASVKIESGKQMENIKAADKQKLEKILKGHTEEKPKISKNN